MKPRAPPRDAREVFRDEFVMSERVAGLLAEGPRTIPELAKALGAPEPDVTKWVMAMRRFGRLVDVPKSREEDYYRYRLVEGAR